MHIRDARENEAGILSRIAIESKSFWGYPQEFIDACRHELACTAEDIRHGCFVVVEAGGRIRGFYALDRLSSDEVELDALFVSPDAIGEGYGRALMEDAKLRAKSRGARKMTIQSDPNAVRFYRASGAGQTGSCESRSIPGRQLPLLAITLR